LRGENASLAAALALARRRAAELPDENATPVGEWRQRHEALLLESREPNGAAVTALEEEIGRLRGAHDDLAAVRRSKDKEIERLGATLPQYERARARDDHYGLAAQIERLVREREEPPREPPEIPEPDENETRMKEEDERERESKPTPRKPRKRVGKKRKG
jgi:hypothetical protein